MKTYIVGTANYNQKFRIIVLNKWALLRFMEKRRINEGYRETDYRSTLAEIRREFEWGTSDWKIISEDAAKEIGLEKFDRYGVWGVEP